MLKGPGHRGSGSGAGRVPFTPLASAAGAGGVGSAASEEGAWDDGDAFPSAALAALAHAPPAYGPGNMPLFILPGVSLTVRSEQGQLIAFAPAFLSLGQLAAVAELAKHVAREAWAAARARARA